MEDKDSIIIKLQETIDSYNVEFHPELKDVIEIVGNTDIDSAPKNELKPLLVSLRKVLRKAMDINYTLFCISLALGEYIEKKEMEKDNICMIKCNNYLGATQTNIQRIQNLCIFPIMLRLSMLTSREARNRDFIILGLSVLISCLFSYMLFDFGVKKNSRSQVKHLQEIKNIHKDETSLILDTLETNHIEKIKSDDELIYKIDSLLEQIDQTKNRPKENN